ncbi:hypothetical protein BCR39DRAFT_66699 [Naematelia encephala]|uniref:Uncharacterized protein n=1 Tax=Naematelia encephala TaxID=71784 RepID=A0A1Y2AGR9_9TREE|nr:hypothetical protein BCR39DRAFT_66699 [Naematelia encephala]
MFMKSWARHIITVTIARSPELERDWFSDNQFCGACHKVDWKSRSWVRYILNGGGYDQETLILKPGPSQNITLGSVCRQTFENKHATMHTVYTAFHQFYRTVFLTDTVITELLRQNPVKIDEIIVRLNKIRRADALIHKIDTVYKAVLARTELHPKEPIIFS